MPKVMVWNFKTEKYEQATKQEGKELIALIESMNADCAAQHQMQRTAERSAATIRRAEMERVMREADDA